MNSFLKEQKLSSHVSTFNLSGVHCTCTPTYMCFLSRCCQDCTVPSTVTLDNVSSSYSSFSLSLFLSNHHHFCAPPSLPTPHRDRWVSRLSAGDSNQPASQLSSELSRNRSCRQTTRRGGVRKGHLTAPDSQAAGARRRRRGTVELRYLPVVSGQQSLHCMYMLQWS